MGGGGLDVDIVAEDVEEDVGAEVGAVAEDVDEDVSADVDANVEVEIHGVAEAGNAQEPCLEVLDVIKGAEPNKQLVLCVAFGVEVVCVTSWPGRPGPDRQ